MTQVSVLIPTYNRQQYLVDAIKSVQTQTYSHWEIIIVDDGSTDATKQAVETFVGNIKYIYQQNQGVSFARNRAFAESTGEYILFLDSDDYLLPNALDDLTSALDLNPDCIVVYSDGYVVDNNGMRLAILSDYSPRPFVDTLETLIVSNPIGIAGTMVRRSAIEKLSNLFDTEMIGYEDWDLFIRIKANGWGSFCFAHAFTYCYRFHGGNKSAPKSQYATQRRNAFIHGRLKVLNAGWFNTLTVMGRIHFFRDILTGVAVGNYDVQKQLISKPEFLLLPPFARADIIYYMVIENLLQAPNFIENGYILWQAIRWSPCSIRLYVLLSLLFVGGKVCQRIIIKHRQLKQGQKDNIDPVTRILSEHHVA